MGILSLSYSSLEIVFPLLNKYCIHAFSQISSPLAGLVVTLNDVINLFLEIMSVELEFKIIRDEP